MKLVSIYFSAVFLVHYVLVSTEISVLMSFQVLTNLILRAQLFGRVILLLLPNVYVNIKTQNQSAHPIEKELGTLLFVLYYLN